MNQQNEILEVLKQEECFLLLCHTHPDGDTLGSVLALKHRLLALGKNVQMMVSDPIPDDLQFLPGIAETLIPPAEPEGYEVAVAVDAASPRQLADCLPYFEKAEKRLVLDHHGTNPCYGSFNWVDGTAPAAAVVIYRLLSELPGELSPEESICLYTALSTDTGNFIYESTNAESFAIMEALMKAGLPLSVYARKLFREMDPHFLLLLREALNKLSIIGDGKIAGMTISRAAMQRAGANDGHRDGIINYAMDMKGVHYAYLAGEMPDGETKVSLRCAYPHHVDGLAKKYGGGGHAQAAGCTLEMVPAKAAALMERELSRLLAEEI